MEQDKLKFAKNCKIAEEGFKNRKKLLRDFSIACIFPAAFAVFMSIFTSPIILTVLMIEVLLYGSFATYAHLCNRDDINKCGKEYNLTYADYKQMKKSGELERLYKQIEEMQKQEANEMYSQYLDFVKGKTYTSLKTSSIESNEEIQTDDVEINNNF